MAANDSKGNTSDIVLVGVVPDLCKLCSKTFRNKEQKIDCSGCKANFHLACAKNTDPNLKTDIPKRNIWKCPGCKNKKFWFTQNTSTPTKETQHLDLDKLNETIEILRKAVEKHTEATNEFREEVNNLKMEVIQLNSKIKTLEDEKVEKEKKIITLEERVNKLEQQNSKKWVEDRLNTIDQKNLRNWVEIVNLPENLVVNPKEAALAVARESNIIINDSDIIDSYCVKKKNKVLVHFSSYNIKQNYIDKVREKKLSVADLAKKRERNSAEQSSSKNCKKVYVNEQLTATNKRILWEAKDIARSKKWKYVWVKNGRIFVKKADDSAALQIRNTSDLSLII